MRVNSFKIAVILLLSTLMFVYNNCGSPFGAPSPLFFESNIYGGSAEISYNAFEETVYPITRSNCVSCHSTQQPAHASDNIKTAHDALISGFKVNFNNIPASRMVKKLREENHNCWGDCDSNADEMEAAIAEWKSVIADSGTQTDVTAPVVGILTSESQPLQREFDIQANTIKTNVINLSVVPAMLNPPMVRTTNAEDGTFLMVPNSGNGILTATDPSAGLASLNFNVRASSANYRIWGLVNAPNTNDNGFYTNITTTTSGVKEWEIPVTQGWEWRQLTTSTFSLNANSTHSLQIRQRKDGTKIKQVVLTSDNTFSGITASELTGITLTYDLSEILQVPGITFKVDVVDYDPYSYKFNNPRIVTTAVNVKAKNVKLLVNRTYNPQHATYTLINKVATPTDGKLSDYAMVVIKDQGLELDKIQFSFEELKIVDENGGDTTTDPSLAASEESFRTTVWPISRNSCISCHTVQNPAHAHDDYKEAHDIVVTQNVVNFANINNSKIVTKVRGGHQCGNATNCNALGDQFVQAITTWKAVRDANP